MQANVAIFRPPNSYILHCHGKCGLFTLYLKGNDMKNSKFGKSCILYMYTVGPQCKIFNYGLQEELMGAKWLHSGRNKWNWVNHLWFHEKWCATKLFSINFWNVWLIILTTWNFKMPAKLQFLDHQIVTSCIAMVNVVFLLFIWKEMAWKISKFGKSWILYMYTLGPQCKIFIYGLQEELMGAKWLHSGRNKWKWVNHLGFHEKWCATKLFISIFEMFGW